MLHLRSFDHCSFPGCSKCSLALSLFLEHIYQPRIENFFCCFGSMHDELSSLQRPLGWRGIADLLWLAGLTCLCLELLHDTR